MSEELRQYLQKVVNERYGGRARALAVRATLNQNTVGNILTSGSGAPESLIKLAPHVGKSRLEMFVLAGWLKSEDLEGELTGEEEELLRLYREGPPARKQFLLLAARESKYLEDLATENRDSSNREEENRRPA
jgi:hypothetical protein